jgi:hypothetical protein
VNGKQSVGPPMTLGNMRAALGAQRLIANASNGVAL